MLELFIVLHILGATIWTGGHLVLACTVLPRALSHNDPKILHDFESGYEKLGIPALIVQVLSGFYLAHHRFPDPVQWFLFEDAAATGIAIKFLLLAVTIGLAVHARFRVLPDLDAPKLRAMAWHIVPVTIFSVAFVVVGVLIRV